MYRSGNINYDLEQYIPLLVRVFSKDGDIIALYLFGSYAEGKQTPVSDIDLAILLDRAYPSKHYFDKKIDLLSIVTSILKTDEVDLVILNQAPASLSYRVLSRGRLLFEREDKKEQRVYFQAMAFDRHFDFQHVEKVVHQGLIRRIKEGGFGG